MKAGQASGLRQSLDRFVRWFFNVSPSAQLDAPRPKARPAAVAHKGQPPKQRRRLRHGVLTKSFRER
jgi:hypothetical protein